MTSAITDTGYSEQVMRTAQELAETIRPSATVNAQVWANAVLAIARAAVEDGKVAT